MIFNFPEQEKLGKYNIIQVFLKNAADKPVCLKGKVLNVSDDTSELILETEKEYASFLCSEVSGVRLGVQE